MSNNSLSCGRYVTRTRAGVTLYIVSNDAPRPAGHLPFAVGPGLAPGTVLTAT